MLPPASRSPARPSAHRTAGCPGWSAARPPEPASTAVGTGGDVVAATVDAEGAVVVAWVLTVVLPGAVVVGGVVVPGDVVTGVVVGVTGVVGATGVEDATGVGFPLSIWVQE
jgi:hypothetical protein